MILYTDNKADSASITDSEATVNYPPSNVKDSRLSRIYKTSKSPNLDINAGGGLKNISDAYTNLVQDPTDLTTGNWVTTNSTIADSGRTVNGNKLWVLESTVNGTQAQIQQSNFADLTADSYLGLIIQKDNVPTAKFFLIGTVGGNCNINVNFDTKSVVPSVNASELLEPYWIDDDTVQVFIKCSTTATVGSPIDIRFTTNSVDANVSIGDKVRYSQPILVDATETAYPFISGSKSADTITESFTMPDRFTFVTKLNPFFQFDDGDNHDFFSFYISGTQRLRLLYLNSGDQPAVLWNDGGTERQLVSTQFDDGTSFENINQDLTLIGSLDLNSGGQNDSRFIVLDKDGNKISEDTAWNGTPSIKSSTFNTLSVGYYPPASTRGNAEYEYLRIYEGLLVGTITSYSDVDALVEDKAILFDKTYQSKITATDLLIANSTIRDGDTITLQANDVDSWGTGTPLYETVVWDKNIIRHNFTESSYQYWRLSVNSSNEIEIGRLYLGGRYQAPGVAPTITQDYNSASVKSRSISGQAYQDTNYKYRIIGVRHPAMVFDDKEEFEKILDTVDIGTPFFVYFEESDDNCTDLQAYYVTIEGEGFRFTPLTNNQYHTLSYDLREEV